MGFTASLVPLIAASLLGISQAEAATVLVETFEAPDTTNFITYNVGQSITTLTNTWSVTTSGVDLFEDSARPEVAAFDGGQAIDLTGSPGAGVIETTFATTPGLLYDLVFHYARNNGLGTNTGDAMVEVIGASTLLNAQFQHNPVTHPFSAYLQFSQNFTADSTAATLRFTSLDAGVNGITLDGISITAVPAPATLWLLGTGMLGLIRFARRRCRT